MDDHDEFYMAIIEKRNRQRLIERGVRNDPITRDYEPPEPKVAKKKKKRGRRR